MPGTQKKGLLLTIFIEILGTDGVRLDEVTRWWSQQPCDVRKMCRGGVSIIVLFEGKQSTALKCTPGLIQSE